MRGNRRTTGRHDVNGALVCEGDTVVVERCIHGSIIFENEAFYFLRKGSHPRKTRLEAVRLIEVKQAN